MPDTFTHYSLSYVLFPKKKLDKYLPVFLLGTVLPDILGRIPEYFLRESYWFLVPFHALPVFLVICYLVSMLFEENIRKQMFKFLVLGCSIHLLVDLCQVQFGFRRYYYPLFPFSFKTFGVPIFKHIDDSMYIVPILFIANLVVYFRRRKVKRHEKLNCPQ